MHQSYSGTKASVFELDKRNLGVVDVVESLEGLKNDVHGLIEAELSSLALEPSVQAASLAVFHDQVEHAVRAYMVEDLHYVRVPKSLMIGAFPLEHLPGMLTGGNLGQHDLEGHFPAPFLVSCKIHPSHASPAQLLEDGVSFDGHEVPVSPGGEDHPLDLLERVHAAGLANRLAGPTLVDPFEELFSAESASWFRGTGSSFPPSLFSLQALQK